jgi:hypothetical protein
MQPPPHRYMSAGAGQAGLRWRGVRRRSAIGPARELYSNAGKFGHSWETPRKTRTRLRLRLRSAHQRTSGAPRLEDFDAVARHCWTMAQRVGGRRRGWKAAIVYWYPFLGFNFTNYSPAPPRGFFYVGARPMISATEAA